MAVLHLYNMPHAPGEPDSVAIDSDVWPPEDEIEYQGERYILSWKSPDRVKVYDDAGDYTIVDFVETKDTKRGAGYNWRAAD